MVNRLRGKGDSLEVLEVEKFAIDYSVKTVLKRSLLRKDLSKKSFSDLVQTSILAAE